MQRLPSFSGILLLLGVLHLAGLPGPTEPPMASADNGSISLWFHNREQPSHDGIAVLRGKGPTALRGIFKEFFALRAGLAPKERRSADTWLDPWIDKVCAQKYCRASQLYWFTDLSLALAEARKQNKPLLRLRLLGQLDEELSCANSRYFRLLLYPHPAVAPLLRENFILMWDSERPVPKVTIDFGTGHEIVTTLTGNSIHYVYDSQGRLIDAIPGLSDPQVFAAQLKIDETLSREVSNLAEAEFLAGVYKHHQAALAALDAEWLTLIPPGVPVTTRKEMEKEERPGSRPDAVSASTRAITKNLTQAPLLKAAGFAAANPIDQLNRAELWRDLAKSFQKSDPISNQSRQLIEQDVIPVNGTYQPDYKNIYENLKPVIALDTVRNRFLLHAEIHRWMSSSDTPIDFEHINTRVYRELFLSPSADPWMGLLKSDSFSGLKGNGGHFTEPSN